MDPNKLTLEKRKGRPEKRERKDGRRTHGGSDSEPEPDNRTTTPNAAVA